MTDFIAKLKIALSDRGLRSRILFVLGALFITRILATIPVPGVDTARLAAFFSGNDFLGFLNIFSGGGLSNLSIVMLGVGSFITASIIMQVMGFISPKLKAMQHEEGEAGRARFSQISRMLTVPVAVVQGAALLFTLEQSGAIVHLGMTNLILNVIIITGGAVLMMWIGELITEFGIGNGTSLIIFAGIVSRFPSVFAQTSQSLTASDIPTYLLFVVVALFVLFAVVFVSEAERPIPVTYAKRTASGSSSSIGGISTYLPLRVNQAGVMPIIFAMSILLFPQMILSFVSRIASNDLVRDWAIRINEFVSGAWVHGILYFLLVLAFTYFYTAVSFDPDRMAKNLQQSGAFVPGVRPGQSTSEYVAKVLTRITLVGAVFLGIVAVLPLIAQAATGITSVAVGGTSLLIAVSVVTDLIKKIEAQATLREY